MLGVPRAAAMLTMLATLTHPAYELNVTSKTSHSTNGGYGRFGGHVQSGTRT